MSNTFVPCKECDGQIYNARIVEFKDKTKHVEILCAACGQHYTYAKNPEPKLQPNATEAMAYELKVGKYIGKRIAEVFVKDPGYISWFADQPKNSEPAVMCRAFLAESKASLNNGCVLVK